MGLDQYLYAEISLPDYERLRPECKTPRTRIQGDLRIKIIQGLGLDKLLATNNGLMGVFELPALIKVRTQVAYWRKCNQIHAFFTREEELENCAEMSIDRDELEELQKRIAQVKADHSLAEELLPSQSGFFFGSTDYDEGYFKDLERTEEVLKRLLAHEDEDISYTYTANW
jgi:hypothetical protein